MDDLIERQAAIDLAKDLCVPTKDGSIYRHRCVDPDAIRELPSAQPERKKGKWLAIGNSGLATCKCGHITDRYSVYNFCPNCGADMRGEQE